MFRRLFGAVVAAGVVLVPWGALGQPSSSRIPAVGTPAHLMAPVFRPGIAPAPGGAAGKYELRHLRSRALFTDSGVELSLPSRLQESRSLRWSVAGGRAVLPRVEKPRETKFHRMMGPAKSWEREVPTYGGLRYPGVLPGVELWFEERAEGVEYGFRAERGADLRRVDLEYSGAREVRVVEEGRALEVDLGEGVLREQGLHCAQEGTDGRLTEVGCRFTRARPVGGSRWAYAIEVDVEDPERPVVVDPLVLWNTYLGGADNDAGLWAIEQNAAGDIFIAGTTGVPAPPGGGGVIGTGVQNGAGSDVIVARFQRDGRLVWWTLFGGNGADGASGLLLGESDALYVTGFTRSTVIEWQLPDGTPGGRSPLASGDDGDAFVARFDSTGRRLDWFERINWGGEDNINGLLWGSNGRLFIAGQTLVKRTESGTPIQTEEAFISRLDPSQRRKEWDLSILGPKDGKGDESVRSLMLKDDSSLYATGYYSDDYFGSGPKYVTNAFIAVIPGVNEATAPSIVSSLSIGGEGIESGIAITRPAGAVGNRVLVWGNTIGTVFPLAGQINGEADIFVSMVEDDGGNLSLKETKLLGGSGRDLIDAVKTGPTGRVYLGGNTRSPDLPAEGGFDTTLDGNNIFPLDGFVARVRLEPEIAFEWVSYVGGNQDDEVLSLHVDNQNPERLFIGGRTKSSDFQYSEVGLDTSVNGAGFNNLFLLAVDVARPSQPQPEPEPDQQLDPLSPLGWSCGASVTSGGPGALALGVLVGLALLISRRRPRA